MAFRIQQAEADLPRFEFEWETTSKDPEGNDVPEVRTYSIPLIQHISVESAEAFEDGRDVRGMMLAVDDDDTRSVIRSFNAVQLKALIAEWEKASDEHLGESLAS